VAAFEETSAAFDSIQVWIGNTLNPDLFVSTSQSLSARDFHFPASMYGQLIQVPGIDEVQPVQADAVQPGACQVCIAGTAPGGA